MRKCFGKSELIDGVSDALPRGETDKPILTKGKIKLVLETFYQVIIATLAAGESVLLTDIGRLYVKTMAARTIGDPINRDGLMHLPERKKLAFTATDEMFYKLNGYKKRAKGERYSDINPDCRTRRVESNAEGQ